MQLIVGTDSTWSIRTWICSQLAELEIDLLAIDLSAPDHKAEIYNHSPTGLVPLLKVDGTGVHDSLSIAEFFNETSNGKLFPKHKLDRAYSRSLCAELHSGFSNLRRSCPFSLKPVAPLDSNNPDILRELNRVESIFENAQLPFMFDDAGAVDAFYSVLAYRLQSYGINFKGRAGEYQMSLINWPMFSMAIAQARSWKKNKS